MRKAIMRRVWGIYLMRQLGSPVMRLTAFFAICLAITSSVSMPNVIHNALASSNVLHYALIAVANTRSAVQLGVLLAGLLVVWTLFDAFRERSEARVSI